MATLSTGSGKRKAVGEEATTQVPGVPRTFGSLASRRGTPVRLGTQGYPILNCFFLSCLGRGAQASPSFKASDFSLHPPAPLSSGLLGPSALVTTLPLSLCPCQLPTPPTFRIIYPLGSTSRDHGVPHPHPMASLHSPALSHPYLKGSAGRGWGGGGEHCKGEPGAACKFRQTLRRTNGFLRKPRGSSHFSGICRTKNI